MRQLHLVDEGPSFAKFTVIFAGLRRSEFVSKIKNGENQSSLSARQRSSLQSISLQFRQFRSKNIVFAAVTLPASTREVFGIPYFCMTNVLFLRGGGSSSLKSVS